jgi:alpha-tubulin suppressor-like RCC1 family protein
VTQVCAQGSTTSYGLALRNDGTVWFWGHDVAGALPGQGSSRIDVLMVPVNAEVNLTHFAVVSPK